MRDIQDIESDVVGSPFIGDVERITEFLRLVYRWMFAGLAITAATTFVITSFPSLLKAMTPDGPVFYLLIMVELTLMLGLTVKLDSMSPSAASVMFIIYSVINGVALTVIFFSYTRLSINMAVWVTAAMFGALALYGTLTQKSLAHWSSFLFMGLAGLVIASFISLFWYRDMMDFVMSVIGITVFTGLTAYDANRMKRMALSISDEEVRSHAVIGALVLYLNVVFLFVTIISPASSKEEKD